MKKRRIESQWLIFRSNVVPANAGSVQVEETRRAFYAGAATLFGTIMDLLEPGAEATENDLQAMDEIARELAEYTDSLRRSAR